MDWHVLDIHIRTAARTPWDADTLFGHLCWAIVRRRGEDRLKKFLEDYRHGKPPFLLSNGFPRGYLPMPVLPPRLPLKGATLKERRKRYQEERERKRRRWLTLEEFNRTLRGETVIPSGGPEPTRRVGLRNQVNRATGTTGEERELFTIEEDFRKKIWVFVRAEDRGLDLLREGLADMAATGYGKRKTAGYGAIASWDLEPFSGFDEPEGSDAFVSLSNFCPARGDPTGGFWELYVKYGKLGEEMGQRGNPFKRPLAMLRAGATFRDSPVRPFYGRLVEGIAPAAPEVVQYAFALPVPMRYGSE